MELSFQSQVEFNMGMAAAKKSNDSDWTVTLKDVQEAQRALSDYLTPTDLVRSLWLSEMYGCEVFLKMEINQPIGSFKLRGALNKIRGLTADQKEKGVLGASAGNHAQGIAWAAKQLRVHAQIIMPEDASIVKVQNTQALGAEVILKGKNYDEAYAYALEHAQKTGRMIIHAFEDPSVIAGQGTLALELLEQLEDMDIVIGSVGGGGLMAGIATVFQALKPNVKLIGTQAAGAPSMARSFESKKAVVLDEIETFADGIAVAKASETMRRLLVSKLDRILLAQDEQIAAAILIFMEKCRIVVEGAGAVPLAVLDQIKKEIYGKKVVLVVSGGNIDVNLFSRIIDLGLTRTGRRVRINAQISDRPGSLSRLTKMIAEAGANVLQVIHDRNDPSAQLYQTRVALTLETRSQEHSQKVIAALQKGVLRLEQVQ